MSAEKSIPLSRKYEAHGQVFDSVVLRAPKLRDHIAIGDPIEAHRGPMAMAVSSSNISTVSRPISTASRCPASRAANASTIST